MIGFELMLIAKGYVKHKKNLKTNILTQTDEDAISTATDTFGYYYVKDGVEIMVGLNEYDSVANKPKPITICYPRPNIEIRKKGFVYTEELDDSMNYVLSCMTQEEIYEAMFNKSMILKFDLS